MNHTLGEIIGQILVSAGLGKWEDTSTGETDWIVTYQTMADAQDYPLAIMCAVTEGKREEKRSMRTGEPAIFPGCAIQVRAYDDKTASVKAWQIAKYLERVGAPGVGFKSVTIDGTRYCLQNFSRMYDPVFLMQEDRDDRRVWVFRGNVTLHVQES